MRRIRSKPLNSSCAIRLGRRPKWKHENFGVRVIDDFEKLRKMAEELSHKQGKQEQAKTVQIHLIRLCLGFLVRAFIAKRPRE